MFFSHFAMQSNYLFQWMKPSLKVMIFLQQIDKAWHQFFGRTRQNCLTPHPFAGSMCLVSDKKKLIACARVRCKRRVDSVAASPREYLVRRAAKNVISPPKTTQNPPKPTAVYKPWSNYLHYTTLHHTTLHYTTLHYTTLYTEWHCTTARQVDR